MSTRVRKHTQFGRFGHPRAGRPRGAIPGANGGRYRATQGDWPRQFAQLNALPSSTTAPLKKSCDGAETPGQLLLPWRAEVSVVFRGHLVQPRRLLPGRRISRYRGVRHSTAVAGSAPAASTPPLRRVVEARQNRVLSRLWFGLDAHDSALLAYDDADLGHHELAKRVAELQHTAGRQQQGLTSVQDGQHSLAASTDDESPVADAPLTWLAAVADGRDACRCSSAAGGMVLRSAWL